MAWLDSRNEVTQAGLNREIRKACAHLGACDPVVASLIDAHGPYRLKATSNYFQVLLETIVSQQLSTKAARAIYRRLVDNLGRRTPGPARVRAATDSQLLGAGLSRSKATYVRNVADAFCLRRLGPKTFGRMTDAEVVDTLVSIKGIGQWSAHMFLIFALARLDVFPIGDLGLRNAMKAQYRLRRDPSDKRLHSISDRWRPYRTVGTLYLWKSYDSN